MATFKPPYGTKDQHVTSPAKHFGYHYLVAYHVDGGSQADYIHEVCADAHEAHAPKDAVCHTFDGGWKRRGELTNLMLGRRLDGYARALVKYEADLKAEQR